MTESCTRSFENEAASARFSGVIWAGSLELHEKHAEILRSQRQIPCQISSRIVNDELEISAKGWPKTLAMQFIPKTVVASLGHNYFENAPNVLFSFQPCETFNHVKQTMETGLAGCVHFGGVNTPTSCLIKVLLLLYSKERQAFIGFIPTDQENFIVRLREIIQHHKRQVEIQRAGRVKGVIVRSGPELSPIGISAAGGMIQDEIIIDDNNQNHLHQEQQQQHIPNGGGSDTNTTTNMIQPPQQQQIPILRNYGALSFLIPSSTSSFSPFGSNYEPNVSRINSNPSGSTTTTNSSSQPNNNSTTATTTEMEVGNTETDIKGFISNILTQHEQKNAIRHLEAMNSIKNYRDVITTLTQLSDRQRDTIHCLTIENERLRARLYGNNNNTNSSSPFNNPNSVNQGIFQNTPSRLNPTRQRIVLQQQQSQVPNGDTVLDDLTS